MMSKKLYIEIADDHISREYGLKDRKHLGKNAGMLFSFPKKNVLSFWMSQTYVPLDIAFVDEDGTIGQIETMVPLSTKAIRSNKPYKYALEVNKGWFDNNNIGVGKRISGHGLKIEDSVKTAQTEDDSLEELRIDDADLDFPEDDIPEDDIIDDIEGPEEIIPSPAIELNQSFEQIFEEAGPAAQDLIMIYQKDGVTLPPKVISPIDGEYEIERGANGTIVRAYDNSPNFSDKEQTLYGKTFLLDNIIDLEPYSRGDEGGEGEDQEKVEEIQEGLIVK